MAIAAIAIGVFVVGVILGSFSILRREMGKNYLGTHPAEAQIEVPNLSVGVENNLRQLPEVEEVEVGAIVETRFQKSESQQLHMMVFVTPDWNRTKVNSVRLVEGRFPKNGDEIALEREALKLIDRRIGDSIMVGGNSRPTQFTIVGITHDSGVAPAWQEQTVYAYASEAALLPLQADRMDLLKIRFKNHSSRQAIEDQAVSVSNWLNRQNQTVEQIRIPPPARHPHQGQMNAILSLLTIFAGLTLVLSGILTASTINALLGAQTKQIGIMKTIGASTAQIASLYLALAFGLSIIATMLSLLLSGRAALGLTKIVAGLLNLELFDSVIPSWVWMVQIAAGILLPVLISLTPILTAANTSIRAAISDYGVERSPLPTSGILFRIADRMGRPASLAIRNIFRRKWRTFLSVLLIGLAGALFISSLNLQNAWEKTLRSSAQSRHYESEIFLPNSIPGEKLQALLSANKNVKRVEIWNKTSAAVFRPDGLELTRTYPDGGHGSLSLRSAPPKTESVDIKLLEGKWLSETSSGQNEVVLNHSAKTFFKAAKVGEEIQMIVLGKPIRLKLVGIVQEMLTPAAAYVSLSNYQMIVGTHGVDGIRVSFIASKPDNNATLEQSFSRAHIQPKQIITEEALTKAIGGHVYILIFILVSMALLLALVGILGLSSGMSTSVLERTREFGIMRTIGARSQTVEQVVMLEGIAIGILSWVIALPVSVLLSIYIGRMIGLISFNFPLEYSQSISGLAMWFLLTTIGSAIATWLPAQTAKRLTIRETLSYV